MRRTLFLLMAIALIATCALAITDKAPPGQTIATTIVKQTARAQHLNLAPETQSAVIRTDSPATPSIEPAASAAGANGNAMIATAQYKTTDHGTVIARCNSENVGSNAYTPNTNSALRATRHGTGFRF